MEHHGIPVPNGLPRAQGHPAESLRVVTMGSHDTTTIIECSGSMLCGCPSCDQDRANRVRQGPKTVRQPWEAAA